MIAGILKQRKTRFAPCVVLLFAFFAVQNLAFVARAGETLTNAADVLALTMEAAQSGVPVSIKGVVTYTETNWNGKFFMQDASGGVYVDSRTQPQPRAGDVLEVSGISHPGGYAPVITKPHWRKPGNRTAARSQTHFD